MATRKLKSIILFALISLTGLSQDLIIKRDSSKLYCKIIKEDSLAIFYKSLRDKKDLELSIPKSEVLKYYNSAAIAKENRTKIDTAEKIYNAKELKKGLYKSSREFITNSPSITKDFTVKQRSEADLLFLHGSDFTFKLTEGYVDDLEIIGFCDGKDIYLNYDHPRGYCKLEYLGHYSFFTYVVHGMAQFALIPDQLMVVDEKGNFQTATPKYVKKLLKEKYPELGAQYEKEEEPRSKRKEYLIKLNDYLKNKK